MSRCVPRALGKALVDISLDGVEVEEVKILIVRDDALPHDLLIGTCFLGLENISFARIGNKFHVYYAEDNPDRGSSYTSQDLKKFCRENGIAHTLNTTKHPQCNWVVERANRTSSQRHRHKDWDLRMNEVERNLNNALNKTTSNTPLQMLHGYSPSFKDGILRKQADESAEGRTDPAKIQTSTRERIINMQKKVKDVYDRKKCRTTTYKSGQVMVMRKTPIPTGEPTKTQPNYRGPLIITDVLSGDTYRVTQLGEKSKEHSYSTTARVSQLKAWPNQTDSDREEMSDAPTDFSENELSDSELRRARIKTILYRK
ncbi:transposon Tf2-6 polyprotein [Caerostris darwini]|uniref:Transposon Tf2-6 polyprotein n=1 Tax=Caerostris darwini TaxID=1538125 RepID=A0AAV4P810_9ARAC|nr:transposon Tf2-6 polyprotein [Caerostris darwini]